MPIDDNNNIIIDTKKTNIEVKNEGDKKVLLLSLSAEPKGTKQTINMYSVFVNNKLLKTIGLNKN
jgi:hypothetical protein